jgi:hypothetical protein
VDLITIKAKTRGKSTREVEYQGIGKFVQDGFEPSVDAAGKVLKDSQGNPVDDKTKPIMRLVTAGVCTDIKDALAAVGGNMQSLLDAFAVGFNLEAYKGVSDALAEFIKPSWTEANVAAFRLAVNNLTKLGIDLTAAVTVASSKLPA